MINFNEPCFAGGEFENIRAAIEEFRQLAGDGVYTRRCREFLERNFETRAALLTPSGTAALELAALLSEIEPGDEVILPGYTFSSTANAFVLRGAKVVFCDIRPDTLNLDEKLLPSLVTSRTRVVVPVHYGGVGCAMDEIAAFARKHSLSVVEDAAQGVGAFYRDRPIGSIGRLGCFSFHETKNFICGEGGALLVNDPELVARAEIVREKGTNRSAFFRGEVDKYTWVDVGTSALPSELAAAFLWAQFEHFDEILRRRLSLWNRYYEAFAPLEAAGKCRRPKIPPECRHNGHLFYLLTGSGEERDRLLAFLKRRGIQAIFHFVPLNESPMAKRLGAACRLPVTADLSRRLVRLPMFHRLSEEALSEVVAGVFDFYG